MAKPEQYDVYFYEAFEEEQRALKHYIGNKFKAGYNWKTIQETRHQSPPAKLISTRTQSAIPPDWAQALSGILSRSTGFDHLKNYQKRTSVNIACGYLPLYCHRAVAEQAAMLWLALFRKLPLQIHKFRNFNRDGLSGLECENKNLLAVGVGNIGYQIVKIGRGLGMHVKGVDIVERHRDVEYVSVDSGLKDADVIVCAMNLTSENVAYFDYERLRKAKSGAVFINIARGEMSPSADLLRLIKERHLAGLALDVFDGEAMVANALRSGVSADLPDISAVMELRRYPQVILTPHNAFNTLEAVKRKTSQSVEQIDHFLKNDTFKWIVPLS